MKIRSIPSCRQQGSIIVTTAIAMSLIVILLIGSELGYLFFLKRELQKTADLAALAGAQRVSTTSCTNARTAALANANDGTTGNMPSGLSDLSAGEVVCGTWTSAGTGTTAASRFTASTTNLNAVQVSFSRTPASLLPFFAGNRTIHVFAIAAQALPRAALTIRSTLLNVNTETSALNSALGGLLGTTLNVSAAGWQGLVDTNLNVLDYLVQLGATAGNYDSVLQTSTSIASLIDAAATVLQKQTTTAAATITALSAISAQAHLSSLPAVKLGDLLGVATGTPSAALNTNIQVFQLVQGALQLGNSQNAASAAFTIPVTGLTNVTAQLQVINPPQISAIGNPELISSPATTTDPNKIYVRTAAIRTFFSINLGNQNSTFNSLQSTLKVVTTALSPLANFLDSVTNASIPAVVGSLVSTLLSQCGTGSKNACPDSKVLYADVLPSKIDVSLDASSGSALVTGHSCTSDTNKSLSVQAATSISNLRVGAISNAFSSSQTISVSPISIAEIGYQETRYEYCTLLSICFNPTWKTTSGTYVAGQSNGVKTVIAGLGLKLDVPVGASSSQTPLTYTAPAAANLPEIDAAAYSGTGSDPSYKSITSQSLVDSLSPTLSGITLTPYSGQAGGIIGTALTGTISLINSLLSTLQGTINTLLSPLLDPAINMLLDTLGVNLAKTDVGARLSCSKGAELVY